MHTCVCAPAGRTACAHDTATRPLVATPAQNSPHAPSRSHTHPDPRLSPTPPPQLSAELDEGYEIEKFRNELETQEALVSAAAAA